jgi:hypothetical protein
MKEFKAYNLDHIASLGWEKFKAEADEQTEANPTAWFGSRGVDRDFLIRQVFDAAEAHGKKTEAQQPALTPDIPDETPISDASDMSGKRKK